MGTIVDATHGKVQLISAADTNSRRTQSGVFYGGIFRLGQIVLRAHARTVALTLLTLAAPSPKACSQRHGRGRASRSAVQARARPISRRLWGIAKGNYRTVGRFAAATVLGANWLIEDKCAGTLVHVGRGIVSFDDFPHRHVFALRAPRSFVAHPGKGG